MWHHILLILHCSHYQHRSNNLRPYCAVTRTIMEKIGGVYKRWSSDGTIIEYKENKTGIFSNIRIEQLTSILLGLDVHAWVRRRLAKDKQESAHKKTDKSSIYLGHFLLCITHLSQNDLEIYPLVPTSSQRVFVGGGDIDQQTTTLQCWSWSEEDGSMYVVHSQ